MVKLQFSSLILCWLGRDYTTQKGKMYVNPKDNMTSLEAVLVHYQINIINNYIINLEQ